MFYVFKLMCVVFTANFPLVCVCNCLLLKLTTCQKTFLLIDDPSIIRGLYKFNFLIVKNLATYLYKMYCIFISILLEVNGMKIVKIIMCTLKIPAEVPLLVGLAEATQKVLTRCYRVANLNLTVHLFSVNFPSK